MEKTVDYKKVNLHYSKEIEFGDGCEHTDYRDEAVDVSVFLEIHYKDKDGEELSDFDINSEEYFDIKKLGHDKARKDAFDYAEKLAKKHSCDFEWY